MTTLEQATFAGGCFWCLQGPFDAESGVEQVQVGYAGGTAEDAVYERVATVRTNHREAIHMAFDPAVVSYRRLVKIFFRQIDPTDPGGQFADRGFQYTTAVMFHTPQQEHIAKHYVQKLERSGKFTQPLATAIVPFVSFFPAEDEHQAYYKKNPLHYKMYKRGSGRQAFIERHWE